MFIRLVITCVVACLPVFALAEVLAEPNVLVFESLDQSLSFALTKPDGTAVPASQIGSIKLMVEEHDYDEMFSYKKEDGKVTLTPTSFLQIGSYQLFVRTEAGDTMVTVYSPLGDIPSIIDQYAARHNITADQAKLALGISQTAGRERVTIPLPRVQYLDKPVRVQMTTPENRKYVWKVNGQVVAEGQGPHLFEYTFPNEDIYNLSYEETQNGALMASSENLVNVVKSHLGTLGPTSTEIP